jgi:hypothetical protein
MLRRLLCLALLGLSLLAYSADGAGARRKHCTISGTSDPDLLVGTSHRDVICGFGGGDVVRAGAGNDLIYAGSGNDVIYPGRGRDVVYGQSGSDTFFAVDGARDFLYGGPGSDRARIDRDNARSIERFFRREANPIVLAAGDIASCTRPGDEATAVLLEAYPAATVAPLGDTAYESGTDEEFAKCYGPSWGRAKARTKPTLGDHEYQTPGAAGYFRYFGAAAGEPGRGYYSYDLGGWHIVVLNSNCLEIGGCTPLSPETLWLSADLTANASKCTLAYWHRPRFSSGTQGPRFKMQPFWQTLFDHGAELVLSADDHLYERFAPQTPAGAADPEHGIREFVVGTGGKSFSPFGAVQPQSEVRNNSAFGVLKLSLLPAGYRWEFIPVAGATFSDKGAGVCH